MKLRELNHLTESVPQFAAVANSMEHVGDVKTILETIQVPR